MAATVALVLVLRHERPLQRQLARRRTLDPWNVVNEPSVRTAYLGLHRLLLVVPLGV